MDCKEAIDLMGDALEGRLSRAFRPGFDEHLAECAPCGAYFENLRIARGVLQHLPSGGTTSPRLQELIRQYRKRFGRSSG
jgi:predicted anti-sigma-YlaC factor YlaD